MSALWILAIASATYLLTISIIVVAQEVHWSVGAVLAALVGYGAFKLFQLRLTRI
jgi:hypothetical protein